MAWASTRRPETNDAFAVRCWGGFLISDSQGHDATPRSRRARALIARLALSAPEPVSRSSLVYLLWADRPEAKAREALRQLLFEIRGGGLAGLVEAPDRSSLSLSHATQIDTAGLAQALEKGDLSDLARRLGKVHGDCCADLEDVTPDFDDWLHGERARRRESLFARAVQLGESGIKAGEPGAVRAIATALQALDPANEPAAALGISADIAGGDRAAAHRRFVAFAAAIRDELGVEPSAETRALLGTAPLVTAPEIPRTQSPAAVAGPALRPSYRRAWVVGAVLALVTAAALAASLFAFRPAPPVVAMLPIQDFSQGGDPLLAQGLTEELRDGLAEDKTVAILGRVSAKALTQALEARGGLAGARREFGVDYVVEGSLRPAGDQYELSVGVVRARDGVRLGQARSQGPAASLFDDGPRLADALLARLSGRRPVGLPPQPGPARAHAHRLYLMARALAHERAVDNYPEAERLLREAVRIDSSYAPAWSELGLVIEMSRPMMSVNDPALAPRRRAEALAAAQRAQRLSPGLPEADAVAGFIIGGEAGRALLLRATHMDPTNAEAWVWLANSWVRYGSTRRARDAAAKAVALEPFWPSAVMGLTIQTEILGRDAALTPVVERLSHSGAFKDLADAVRAETLLNRGRLADAAALAAATGATARSEAVRRIALRVETDALGAMGLGAQAMSRRAGDPVLRARASIDPQAVPMRRDTARIAWIAISAARMRAGVETGESAGLVALYDASFDGPDDFVRNCDCGVVIASGYLIPALRAQGRAADADALLKRADAFQLRRETEGANDGPSRYGRSVVLALQGNSTPAIGVLRSAVRAGWRGQGGVWARDPVDEPAFASLRGDARFMAVRHDLQAKWAAELAAYRARPVEKPAV